MLEELSMEECGLRGECIPLDKVPGSLLFRANLKIDTPNNLDNSVSFCLPYSY